MLEDKAPRKNRCLGLPLSRQCEGCAVLVVPLKDVTMKKVHVNSLTLSSMMQDCYCSTYSAAGLSHPPMISAKAPLVADCSSAKSKFKRRRPRLSFIKHQDCSASRSANQFSHEVGQPAFKPVDRLQSWSGCESGVTYIFISC